MRAIVITRPGDADVLELQNLPMPEPVADQLRVRVAAAGINRADLLQRQGRYPAPFGAPPDIPGLEFAGTVDAVGPLVEHLTPGDRVFGIVSGGSYAEYVLTTERMAVRVPDSIELVQAAAIPEAFMTAHDALVQADFRAGDRVLVHAVGSGVGTAAVQLVQATGGSTIGTARTAAKLEHARALGLGVALDAQDWLAALQAGGHAVDIVLDFVGGPYLQDNLNALALRGRLVLIGTMGGTQTTVDLGTIQRKRLRVIGTVLRSRALEEKIMVTQRFAQQVVPLLAAGRIAPIVERVYPLAEAAAAHRAMERNTNFGKILLDMRA